MRGKFITFEGIEGSGKSSQIRLLADALKARGIKYILTREPGGPPISERIRALLLDPQNKEMSSETELLLYCASRAQHTSEVILPALASGVHVICDRYYDSSYAYQGAARSLDKEIIRILTAFSTYSTDPDRTFLLDLPVEQSLSRIQDRELDRLEQESLSFHVKVREQYLSIAKDNASRYLVLNGLEDINILHRQILAAVFKLIGAAQ
jgi:dTMP kinase